MRYIETYLVGVAPGVVGFRVALVVLVVGGGHEVHLKSTALHHAPREELGAQQLGAVRVHHHEPVALRRGDVRVGVLRGVDSHEVVVGRGDVPDEALVRLPRAGAAAAGGAAVARRVCIFIRSVGGPAIGGKRTTN